MAFVLGSGGNRYSNRMERDIEKQRQQAERVNELENFSKKLQQPINR